MTIERFAADHRRKVSRDECGDSVIRGKRGHLYVDGGLLCAMWTGAAPMKKATLESLGGRSWQGDISRDARGRRVQDAWVKGIAQESYALAVRLVGAKPRHIMTPARRAALEKATTASLPFRFGTAQERIPMP
jgi:hypothetical protein